MSGAPQIEVRDLEVRLGGATVLAIPGLEVAGGEVLALLGPNGAGKSTLIHAMALLLSPSAGTIAIAGEIPSARNITAFRRRMSVVFQDPHLFDRTVADNVAAGLRFRGVPRREVDERVAGELSRFGISHLASRSARKLSGGEAARVSLARAFVLRPEIMLMDEPFSSLDPPTRHALLADVKPMVRGTSTTTVMSTHDFSDAVSFADRIAVLRQGRIVQADLAWNVATRPADRFVARFVGVENVVEVRVAHREGDIVRIDAGGAALHARSDAEVGSHVLMCVRPESIYLTTSPDGTNGTLEARVESTTRMDHYTVIRLDCGFPLCVHVAGMTSAPPAPGSRVHARIRPDDIHLIVEEPMS